MSYLVLALKYRPQNFDEIMGQEHITSLIKKSIEINRTAHAYLFSGPRGVGKTSCARILAKSINCQEGPTVTPCGGCSSCKEIANGTSFDVLEIDGASNRGIDEIRALRENVKFAPNYGRNKIYIVDEVHMLTTEAFNALLKTLEEPPEHVKFIFATTEPNKVPPTIISRCQRFDFKRISIKVLVEGLNQISEKEKYEINQDALYTIAKSAKGSLRDALSILDQLSVITDKSMEAVDVFTMLGLVETQYLFSLADALSKKDCISALEIIDNIIDKGKDAKQLMKDLIEHFRNLMVIKLGGKALGKLVDYPVALKKMLLEQCDGFSLKEIINTIDILIESQDTARITESVRMPMEVAFAKLTYTGEKLNSRGKVAAEVQTEPKISTNEPSAQKGSSVCISTNENDHKNMSAGVKLDSSPEQKKEQKLDRMQGKENYENPKVRDMSSDKTEGESRTLEAGGSAENRVGATTNGLLDLAKINGLWDTLTHKVSKKKMSVATYLQSAVPVEFKGSTLIIGFPKKCSFQKEALEMQTNIKLVEDVFYEELNVPIRVNYKLVDDFIPQEESGEVKETLDTFGGEVISRWHSE